MNAYADDPSVVVSIRVGAALSPNRSRVALAYCCDDRRQMRLGIAASAAQEAAPLVPPVAPSELPLPLPPGPPMPPPPGLSAVPGPTAPTHPPRAQSTGASNHTTGGDFIPLS